MHRVQVIQMGTELDMNKNSIEPWEYYPEVWPTRASFFSWLRGGLRRAIWEKYPGKIIYKKSHLTKPPEGYTGKAKSGAVCALTGVWTGNSKLQVDHIVGEASLRDWCDIESFARHLCTNDDNMQLVEVEAHKIKSYSERQGMSFEDAMFEKKYILQFKKLNSEKQKETLTSLGVDSIMLSTAAKRVAAYRNYLKERNSGNED